MLATRPHPELAALRAELRLMPADANRDGSPAWMIQDPVSNRFYRIGWLEFEILVRWQHGPAAVIAQDIREETTLHVEAADVDSLGEFLRRHSLLRSSNAADVNAMRQHAAKQKAGIGWWLLHHYLFFRLPLLRPQDKLARLASHLGWLFTPTMLAAVIAASVLGISLILHQWDTFTSSLVEQFTWRGAAGFAMALIFAKALHELGHALTATRHGVRVAHMGVAMVVLFPML